MIEFTKRKGTRVGLHSTISQLPINEQLVVRMTDYKHSYVSNAASLAGREIGGRFSVHRDWDGGKYIVTRTA